MIDLEKLTPAPWREDDDELFAPQASATDCRFVVLARLAFDVMMRREWFPVKCGDWRACIDDDTLESPSTVESLERLKETSWPDPFTALVEADKWYRENVEGK